MTDTPKNRQMHVPATVRVINASLPKWDEQNSGVPEGFAWLSFRGKILAVGLNPLMMRERD